MGRIELELATARGRSLRIAPDLVCGLGLGLTLLLAACGERTVVISGGADAGDDGGETDDAGGTSTGGTGSDTGSDTGDPADDSDDSDDGGWGDCGFENHTVPLVREPVVLVYDASLSMFAATLDDGQGGAVTPWAALHAATTDLIDRYPAPIVDLGAALFPRRDTAPVPGTLDPLVCGVSSPLDVPITTGGEGIVAGIPAPGAAPLVGATPGGLALREAYGHLMDLRAAAPDGRGHVVYVTDGAPGCRADVLEALVSCGDDADCQQAAYSGLFERHDDAAVAGVVNAAQAGITTYVVGVNIPDIDPLAGPACTSDADCPAGTECCDPAQGGTNCPVDGACALPAGGVKDVNPRAALAAMAQAGGHPSPPEGDVYAVSDAAGLDAALRDIEASLPTCDVALPEPDVGFILAASYTTVYIGERAFGNCFDEFGEPVPNCSYFLADEATCDTEDGVYWDYTDVITLCGDVCDEFKQAGTMDVTYGWLCE